MQVKIARNLYTDSSTQGELSIDGAFVCYTLEPPVKTDGSKPRAIDDGTYPLTIRWSTDHNRHLPHVENVPDFVAVEHHVGNTAKDTLGCTLVGHVRGPEEDWISNSTPAFAALMAKYMAGATERNPEEKNDKLQVWDVGTVTYYDAR